LSQETSNKLKYKFIDLFAGIGGFHLALHRNGMQCVFASEIDKEARKTYLANHQINPSQFNEDITTISPELIPDHDILCAGFPCQPFSQAGYKKGFKDDRGNLFNNIRDILEAKRPKAFILENVRHLLKHDSSRTFNIIYEALISLDYYVEYKVIKASEFGRPQLRPRIYIVGFDNKTIDTSRAFLFPKEIPLKLSMSDVWEAECSRDIGFTLRVGGKSSPIDDRRNWDGYIVNGEMRRLTPKEGRRMMGFPDSFEFPTSNSQAMKQLGNSVCVDVVEHIAEEIKTYLKEQSKNGN
jgi:DNA (cytosine-5)-methyltransferase 1